MTTTRSFPCCRRLVVAAATVGALLAGCSGSDAEIAAAPTTAPTEAATATAVPTATPAPTATPRPTATAAPTPTATPRPTPTPAPVEANVVIVDSGFYVERDNVSWWVELVNLGAGVASDVQVSVDAVSGDGLIVDDDRSFIDYVLPFSTTYAVGTMFDPPAEVVSVEVEGGFNTLDTDPDTVLSWDVGEPTVTTERRTTTVVAEVSHTGSADQDFVEFVAVFKRGDEVVGVERDFVDVPAGRTVLLEVRALSERLTTVGWDTVELYVAP